MTFDSNGGTAVESQQVVNSGYASEPSKPTKDGKVFTGWYTDPGLTTKFNFSSTPITSDITLYAKWEDKVVTQYITKIEINNFNPEFHTGMTGTAAKKSLTFSYPDDANYSKGNDNRYIKQNGSFIYDNNLTAGAATLIIAAYANPFSDNEENPAYDFDEANLNSIEVWINGEKRTDVEVKGYNSAWRTVEIYIPVTVSEYKSLNHTVSFAANGGTGTMADVTGISGEYTLPENDFTAPEGKYFKGWGRTPDASTVISPSNQCSIFADTTFYAIWGDITYIDTVAVRIDTPVAGTNPKLAVSNTENVSVSATLWIKQNGGGYLTETDTFVEGEPYRAVVMLEAGQGYVFAENPTVIVNGSATSTATIINGYIYFAADFTATNPSKSISVKDIQNSDTLTFKVDLKSDETITGITIATVYDNDGKFIAVKQYDAAPEVSFIFSDVKNAATIKVFWWNGIGSMMPQAKNVTVSL